MNQVCFLITSVIIFATKILSEPIYTHPCTIPDKVIIGHTDIEPNIFGIECCDHQEEISHELLISKIEYENMENITKISISRCRFPSNQKLMTYLSLLGFFNKTVKNFVVEIPSNLTLYQLEGISELGVTSLVLVYQKKIDESAQNLILSLPELRSLDLDVYTDVEVLPNMTTLRHLEALRINHLGIMSKI